MVAKAHKRRLITTQCYRRAVVAVWDHRSSGRGRVWAKDSSRNEAGRGTGAALGSHGRVEQAVNRGEVRNGQTLSNRQDFPATAVQGHRPPLRRRDAASASCGGEGAGSLARRKKARTGTSNGTGTRT